MPRDRLAELQASSKHAKPSDSANSEEMKPLKDKDKAMSSSQADFFEALNEVSVSIDTVQNNVEEVKKLQKKILNSVHKDANDHAKLSDLNESNKRLGNKVRNSLKEEQEKVEKKLTPKKSALSLSPSKRKSLTSRQETDLRLRQTQIASQSTRFFNIWNEYNQSQLNYREQTKKLLIKQCKITGNTDLTNEEIEQMLDDGKTNLFATSILDQEKLARQQLMDLQERHGEFLKLEKQIEEVRDLFMEIANLVTQQGEMVDNIYQNVTRATIDVEQGKEHLNKAEQFMKSARKKKIILACILLVIILIILLVILIEFGAFSSSSSSSNSPPSSTIVYVYITESTTAPSTSNLDSSSSSTVMPSVSSSTEEPIPIVPPSSLP